MKKIMLISSLSLLLIGCSLSQSSSSSSSSTSSSSTSSSNTSSSSSSSSTSSTSSSTTSQNSQTSSGGNNMEGIIQEGYVVYINLDGFGRYYYDEAVKLNKVPTLESIASEGVVFKNLKNYTPSITNPMQAMIVSGAPSNKTKNVYRYYDKKTNMVVQQARENAADTLYISAVRNAVHLPKRTCKSSFLPLRFLFKLYIFTALALRRVLNLSSPDSFISDYRILNKKLYRQMPIKIDTR